LEFDGEPPDDKKASKKIEPHSAAQLIGNPTVSDQA
jgi:hypothetical protein